MVKIATKIWKAAESVLKVDLASNVTITGAAVLDSFFSGATAWEGVAKDVTYVEPFGDVEKIDLQGTSADGFQNAELEEKPAVLGELSGTLVLPGDEVVETFFYDAGTAVAGTHTRYRAGKASVRKLAFLINLDDGTDEVSFAITNAIVTSKDSKIGGADAHWEVTFTAKALPRDCYGN